MFCVFVWWNILCSVCLYGGNYYVLCVCTVDSIMFCVFVQWKVLCSVCLYSGKYYVLCVCAAVESDVFCVFVRWKSIMFCVFVRWKVLCSVFRVPPVCWRQFSVILNKASEARRQQCTGDCL